MAINGLTSGMPTSGENYISGLGNGTDFSVLITKLVGVEKRRVSTYETWKNSWKQKNTAFQELNSQLLTLRTALQGMDTLNKFLQKTAASSPADVLTATANGAAEAGTYSYSVAQLAQNKAMVTTSGHSSLSDIVNGGRAGKLVFTYAGATVSNTIPAGSTVRDVVNIININAANTGVRASTLFDGKNYCMQLKGLDTGEKYSLVISGATTLSGFGATAFSTTQNNQDAKFKINGWPTGNNYISRPTNTVSDAIDGISLSLKTSGSGTITVSTNINAVVSNVKTFVEQMNKVRTMLQGLTKYDTNLKQGSLLTGNYGLQMIDSILKDVTASPGVGFDTNRERITSLSALGINTDSDEGSKTFGQLLLDTTRLRALLASNAEGVSRIFAAQCIGDTDSGDVRYTSCVSGITKAGQYDVNYTVKNGKIVSATIGGHPAVFSSNSNTITGARGYDEAGISLTVDNLTNGTYSHTVNLRQGKSGEFVDRLTELTNAQNGPLAILKQNYTTIEGNIQKKIDTENLRIAKMEKNLRERFSRLDTLLNKYSTMQSSLDSYIQKLKS